MANGTAIITIHPIPIEVYLFLSSDDNAATKIDENEVISVWIISPIAAPIYWAKNTSTA